MNKTRLEAFSDGVLAIIITIMVLELKIPLGTDWSSVKALLPTLGSYVFSFIFIGIYWGNHHHLLHTAEHVNGKIIWANLHLLFWLSLVPVATGWMGENRFEAVTVAIYGTLLVCCGLAFTILGNIISVGHPPNHPFTTVYRRTRVKGMWSTAIYLLSIPLAFVHPGISCGLFAVVSLLWIVPNKEVEHVLSEGWSNK